MNLSLEKDIEYDFRSMYEFIQKHIQCVVCYELVFENLECYNCSSLFCASCITELDDYYDNLNDQHDEVYQPRCPHCRVVSHFYENHFVRKVLGQVQLECDHCHEKVKKHNYGTHLDNCQGKLVTCLLCGKRERKKMHKCTYMTCKDCHQLIKKTDKRRHGRTCPCRIVICEFCTNTVTLKDKRVHQTIDCEMYPLVCDFCQGQCLRKHLHEHLQECSAAQVNCSICKETYCKSSKHVCLLSTCSVCNGVYIKGYLSNHLNGNCRVLTNHEKRMKTIVYKRRPVLPPIQEYDEELDKMVENLLQDSD